MHWKKSIIASLLSVLNLAATLPNLGRGDPVTRTIRYGWQDAVWIAVIIVPVLLILIGINRSKTVEVAGWALLILLLVLRFLPT